MLFSWQTTEVPVPTANFLILWLSVGFVVLILLFFIALKKRVGLDPKSMIPRAIIVVLLGPIGPILLWQEVLDVWRDK